MSIDRNNRINVGIVGLGNAGMNLHLKPMHAHPGFEIIAVTDPQEDRCAVAADLTGAEIFGSIDELLARSPVDLVVVATPSHLHYGDALKVLGAGRHCVLEKPMALSFSQATELVETSNEANKKLFVHHVMLHGPEYRHIRTVLETGKLGPLFHVRRSRGFFYQRTDWQTTKANGGGMLNNHGSHMLSVLLPLLGSRVISVHANLANIKDGGDAEDHAHLVMKTENGIIADLVISSAIAVDMPAWVVCGRYGTLISDGKKSKVRYYNPLVNATPSVCDPGVIRDDPAGSLGTWLEENLEASTDSGSGFHDNVYDVLTFGSEQIITPESAAEVVRVTEMAFDSAGEFGFQKSGEALVA